MRKIAIFVDVGLAVAVTEVKVLKTLVVKTVPAAVGPATVSVCNSPNMSVPTTI